MKGKILDFSIAQGEGFISGDDGNRYTFQGKEWKSQTQPAAGTRVDFDIDGKSAIGVYADNQSRLQAQATSLQSQAASVSDNGLDERYRSIYRSSDEKLILGLCGGLAHKFGLPAGVMRIIVFISMWFLVGWLYFVGIFLPQLPTKGIPRSS